MRPVIPTRVNAKGVQAHAHVLGHLLRADKYVKYRRYVYAMRSEFVVCSQEHSQNFSCFMLHGFCISFPWTLVSFSFFVSPVLFCMVFLQSDILDDHSKTSDMNADF